MCDVALGRTAKDGKRRLKMEEMVAKAVEVFRAGGVVIFPTDTVWGIGASVTSSLGIENLYRIKKRDAQKPTALLVGHLRQATDYGIFSDEHLRALSRYWPGALTVVVKARDTLPPQVCNDQGGVGIRWPKSEFVEQVTNRLSAALVTTSANVSGGLTPTLRSEIEVSFMSRADLVVDFEQRLSGTSSTVVDLLEAEPRIIRQGEMNFHL